MNFMGPLIVVNNIDNAKKFYTEVLQQNIKYDFGENVVFEGGFSLHLKSHFARMVNITEESIILPNHSFELYFEVEDIEKYLNQLKTYKVVLLNDLFEAPWGQKLIRFYDLDSHIIEVGENMQVVIKRYLALGLSVDFIAQKTLYPVEQIINCLK